jgi:hypothetical protein
MGSNDMIGEEIEKDPYIFNKKVALLCKGPSVIKVDKEYIDTFDTIAWANLHNIEGGNNIIPNRVDYLFIRLSSYINEQPQNVQDELKNLEIKKIFTTGDTPEPKNVIGRKITKSLSRSNPFKFDASTGLVALNYIIENSPSKILIAGMDLFMKSNDIYYFDFNEGYTGKRNKSIITPLLENNLLVKEIVHHPSDKHMEYIKNVVEVNQNINFEFYTINSLYVENISQYSNVTIN